MDYIISNVNGFFGPDLEEKGDYAIWIKDGRIDRILPVKEIPEGTEVIDGEGKYLLPGLIDLHVHLMWDGSSNPVQTTEHESLKAMAIRAAVNAKTYIFSGITTVRDLGSIDDISLDVAKMVQKKVLNGPRIIASGKTLTITGGHDPFWGNFCNGPYEALKKVREQIYKNASVIKVSATGGVYGRVQGEKVENCELNEDELTVICNEAHKFGLKVASHAIGREGILNSLKSGVDTIEHGHYLDNELIHLMKEKGSSWIPTLYIYDQIANKDQSPSYAKAKAEKIVKRHQKAFEDYFQIGVLVGAGSDAGSVFTPHPSLIEELTTMHSIVDNIREILKTATVNAGQILDIKTGQITEGYIADIILLKENPINNLEALRTVDTVFLEGQKVAL